MKYSPDFLKEIPKSDLHLHLDGSLRIKSLIEMSKNTGTILTSNTEEGLRELVLRQTQSTKLSRKVQMYF